MTSKKKFLISFRENPLPLMIVECLIRPTEDKEKDIF